MYYYQSIQELCHPQKFHISDQYQAYIAQSVVIVCGGVHATTAPNGWIIKWQHNTSVNEYVPEIFLSRECHNLTKQYNRSEIFLFVELSVELSAT